MDRARNVSVSQFVARRTPGPPKPGYRIKVPVVRTFTVTKQLSPRDGRSTGDRIKLAKHVQTLKRMAAQVRLHDKLVKDRTMRPSLWKP